MIGMYVLASAFDQSATVKIEEQCLTFSVGQIEIKAMV
jgi:hypothetical protein